MLTTHTPCIESAINLHFFAIFFSTTTQGSPPSMLSTSMLDVLAIFLSALARLNTKHSFEPLHNSSMSGEV
jgi:hypothetical protein